MAGFRAHLGWGGLGQRRESSETLPRLSSQPSSLHLAVEQLVDLLAQDQVFPHATLEGGHHRLHPLLESGDLARRVRHEGCGPHVGAGLDAFEPVVDLHTQLVDQTECRALNAVEVRPGLGSDLFGTLLGEGGVGRGGRVLGEYLLFDLHHAVVQLYRH